VVADLLRAETWIYSDEKNSRLGNQDVAQQRHERELFPLDPQSEVP